MLLWVCNYNLFFRTEDSPSALSKQLPEDASMKEPVLERTHVANYMPNAEQLASSEHAHFEDSLLDTHVLICFEDSLRLYSIKSVIQVGSLLASLFSLMILMLHLTGSSVRVMIKQFSNWNMQNRAVGPQLSRKTGKLVAWFCCTRQET